MPPASLYILLHNSLNYVLDYLYYEIVCEAMVSIHMEYEKEMGA